MATNGSSFKHENPSSSQFNGHLEKIEQQKLNRKLFFCDQVGGYMDPCKSKKVTCCEQFYRPEIDHKIKVGNRIFKTVFSSKSYHLVCWTFFKNLYGQLG